MVRYYFYAPSPYRASQRKQGVVSFWLKAYYAEQAYSDKERKEVIRFHELDEVTCRLNLKTAGQYQFDFQHGVDQCVTHWSRSYGELKADMEDRGYRRIDESSYFRLRKLALKLLYRHSYRFHYWWGRNLYYYKNESSKDFYELDLCALHYHHRLQQYSPLIQAFLRQANQVPNNILVAETISLFLARDSPGRAKRSQSFKFSLESNRLNPATNAYGALAQAVHYETRDYRATEITLPQYECLRKIAKYLIWEVDELDISRLQKAQDYRVRILDL